MRTCKPQIMDAIQAKREWKSFIEFNVGVTIDSFMC